MWSFAASQTRVAVGLEVGIVLVAFPVVVVLVFVLVRSDPARPFCLLDTSSQNAAYRAHDSDLDTGSLSLSLSVLAFVVVLPLFSF